MESSITKEALTNHLETLKNGFKEKSIDNIINNLPEILKSLVIT